MRDVVTVAIDGLEEVDPGLMEFFAALLGQRLGERLRRSICASKDRALLCEPLAG